MIRIPQVRVVDEEGSQLGVMPTPQALAMAQERGYDLVEVAPMAAPPVVRFLDFGQFKYEATKREKEAKRKQRSVTFKEVRLKPKIATGDFDTRVRRAIQFLEEGDRLKVAVQFRGRELTHPEIGRNLLAKFAERIKDHGVVERAPLLEGKSMHITVASTHKPKVIEGPKHEGGSAAVDGTEAGTGCRAGDGGSGLLQRRRVEAGRTGRAGPAPVASAKPAAPVAEPAAAPAPVRSIVGTRQRHRSQAPASRPQLERRQQPAHQRRRRQRPTDQPTEPRPSGSQAGSASGPRAEPEGKQTVASTGKTAAKPATTTGE